MALDSDGDIHVDYFGNCTGTPGVVTCGFVLEEVQINICCTDELTADHHAVITVFLHEHSWYNVLADMIHLCVLADDVVVTSNQSCSLLWHWMYCLMVIGGYNFLHLSHIVPHFSVLQAVCCTSHLPIHDCH